jgi:Na+/alanine symporter
LAPESAARSKPKAVQVRYFGRMIKQIFHSRSESEGGISSFQAFSVGLASRVGTGNIAGVAIALTWADGVHLLDVGGRRAWHGDRIH